MTMTIIEAMKKTVLFLFFAILILAAVLRLYKLTEVPPGVNQDEASIGYTAYSILKTGKDEYGRQFPVSFESFGDWKLPLYTYTVIPLVSVFGLSELPVRLPSAIFGIITVGLTPFLVRLLFKNNALALLTMFLVAISPWHLHLSRVESESNTAVFLTTLAVILFLKSIKDRSWLIIPSALLFALTYFTYHGSHIFTSLLLIGILLIYKDKIPKTKTALTAFLLFILLVGFILSQTIFSADKTKLAGISIFGDPSVVHAKIELPRNEHENPQGLFVRAFHNRLIFGVERFAQNYLNSFSPQFLFIKGGANKAHNIENFGNMYLAEAPFLFLGLISLIFLKKGREKKLVLWWFLISPIAAGITKDAPHTNRMFTIFPILSLVTAMGIEWVLINFPKQFKNITVTVIIFLFLVNFGIYLDRYYVHFPRNEGENWGLGYKKLSDILETEKFKNKKVVMARPQYSPYIFLLFYQKFDPKKYQESAVRYPPTEDGFLHVKNFDRYEFREIDWDKDIKMPNTVLIDWSLRVPDSIKRGSYKTDEIILSNDKPMFTLIETR